LNHIGNFIATLAFYLAILVDLDICNKLNYKLNIFATLKNQQKRSKKARASYFSRRGGSAAAVPAAFWTGCCCFQSTGHTMWRVAVAGSGWGKIKKHQI
jgi:hypothetical protein